MIENHPSIQHSGNLPDSPIVTKVILSIISFILIAFTLIASSPEFVLISSDHCQKRTNFISNCQFQKIKKIAIRERTTVKMKTVLKFHKTAECVDIEGHSFLQASVKMRTKKMKDSPKQFIIDFLNKTETTIIFNSTSDGNNKGLIYSIEISPQNSHFFSLLRFPPKCEISISIDMNIPVIDNRADAESFINSMQQKLEEAQRNLAAYRELALLRPAFILFKTLAQSLLLNLTMTNINLMGLSNPEQSEEFLSSLLDSPFLNNDEKAIISIMLEFIINLKNNGLPTQQRTLSDFFTQQQNSEIQEILLRMDTLLIDEAKIRSLALKTQVIKTNLELGKDQLKRFLDPLNDLTLIREQLFRMLDEEINGYQGIADEIHNMF